MTTEERLEAPIGLTLLRFAYSLVYFFIFAALAALLLALRDKLRFASAFIFLSLKAISFTLFFKPLLHRIKVSKSIINHLQQVDPANTLHVLIVSYLYF